MGLSDSEMEIPIEIGSNNNRRMLESNCKNQSVQSSLELHKEYGHHVPLKE